MSESKISKQLEEFDFVPERPSYGGLSLTCLDDETFTGLQVLLSKRSVRRRFSGISFNKERREIFFVNAAVTEMGHGQIDICEGASELDGVVSFVAVNRVLVNGKRLKDSDLQRCVALGSK